VRDKRKKKKKNPKEEARGWREVNSKSQESKW
jgi:hypothetical protein